MPHNIPQTIIDQLSRGPAATTTARVAALQNYIQGLLGDTHHTFLQGSYRNDTAISDINDVDIVAVRLTTFSGSHSPHAGGNPLIGWETIFSEIEQKLRNQRLYDWTIERGDKCIKISGAFNADVVPAVLYGRDPQEDPIVVYSFRDGFEKINRPRQHRENGVLKQRATGDHYKPTVRVFKNWIRNHFADDKDTISSFKMEALVHAGDNANFYSDYPASFILLGHEMLNKLTQRTLTPTPILSVCGHEDITGNWNAIGRNNFTNQLRESLDYAGRAYGATSMNDSEDYWRRAFNL